MPRRCWDRSYRVDLLVADGAAALVAALLVHWTGGRWAVAVELPPTWIAAMHAHRAYERSVLGWGAEEYWRVLRGAVALPTLVAVAFWSLAHDPELLNDMMVAIVPTTVIALLGRLLLRRRLYRGWLEGRGRSRALLVGPAQGVIELVRALRRGGAQELTIVGVCLTEPVDGAAVGELAVPVTVGLDQLARSVHTTASNVVVVLPSPEIDAGVLRSLSWSAAAEGAEFLLAPVVADVAASRMKVRPNNGVPLMQLRAPRLSRSARLPKELLERLLAALLLVVLAPVMLAVALVVRLDSPGPALFRQRRVGQYGIPFTMFKFRTMRPDAEQHRVALAALNDNRDGLLFKLKRDPRITRVGSTLRRYSLDELPQLFNVLTGQMSLVGPRPPLPEEVAAYTHELKRRLLVKPGLTGIWQVSGRSDLPWDEAVRLDLAYVDNWSLGLDVSILLRTAPAVVRGTGAY